MFDGRTWWITGASSGIGAALAVALGQAGAGLVLSGRNEAALAETARRASAPYLVLPFETTDFERIPAVVDQAWSWARERGGGGQLVAISSVAGFVGVPLRSAYSAAKHGLIGYSDSVRAETAHQGIRVLVVAPGSVRTNVSKNALDASARVRSFSDTAIDEGMAPEAAAARILDALRSGERELVLAEGREAEVVRLRRSDPDKLFDLAAKMIADGYAQQLGATKPKA
jgi:dehydrogenase/reductase SDR family protein 7B